MHELSNERGFTKDLLESGAKFKFCYSILALNFLSFTLLRIIYIPLQMSFHFENNDIEIQHAMQWRQK